MFCKCYYDSSTIHCCMTSGLKAIELCKSMSKYADEFIKLATIYQSLVKIIHVDCNDCSAPTSYDVIGPITIRGDITLQLNHIHDTFSISTNDKIVTLNCSLLNLKTVEKTIEFLYSFE